MTDDIQFGDVQETKPEPSLRPDLNAHFAVVAYENPAEGEIPVFLDLDVMLDMESHAAGDKSVELGGVLLGGQFHDEDGKPFVVITDSLRAKHYESTKGSFKFTKEAWTEITRERNEYPDDLQMVGWYHTHPDWGVFLSGMDMFICDNFFNRPLDMAYVIDPCRGDRAMFQWTKDPRDRCKRQRGFYVIASRYRTAELESAVASLQEGNAMPMENRLGGYTSAGAPIINVSQPPTSQQHNLVVLGMLTVQVCFLALLAWKILSPAGGAETELAAITKELKQIAAQDEARRTQRAVVEVLDQVLSDHNGTAPGLVEKLTELQKRNNELASAGEGNAQRAKQLLGELQSVELDHKIEKESLERTVEDLRKQKKAIQTEKAKLEEELVAYRPKKTDSDKKDEEPDYTWYWVGGLVLGLAALGGIAATLAYRPTNESDLARERLSAKPMNPGESAPASKPNDSGA